MRTTGRTALYSCALSLLASCYGGGSFVCETSDQCAGNGQNGVCQPDHFCSFADSSCDSGQRYGSSSGTNSGVCVGDQSTMRMDGGTTSTEPTPDARECFGTPLQVCHHPPAMAPKTLGASIDTSNDGTCDFIITQTGGPDLCAITASVLTVNTTTVTGSRGLLLLGTDSIVITGSLDASSKRGGQTGAGADPSSCTAAGAGAQDDGGGSGGGGGSFIGKGGDGAQGDSNNSGMPAGPSPGGKAGAAQTTTVVRGGCPGATGGDGPGGNDDGGVLGHGGGALYLIAGNTITIQAAGGVFASGAAGSGGDFESGGGGGGSGGLIGFDAPTITIDGTVAANGGGGGGGGSNGNNNNTGGNGTDGTTTMFDQRATGGTGGQGNPGSPNGGRGAALGTNDGEGANSSAGGGSGGGGGIGLVLVHGTVTGTKVSPAATTN